MRGEVDPRRSPAEIRRLGMTPGATEIGGPFHAPPGRLPIFLGTLADKTSRKCSCGRLKTYRADVEGYVCIPCFNERRLS